MNTDVEIQQQRTSAVLGSQSVAGVPPVIGTGVVSPMSDSSKKINFYPIPQHASLVISTDENFATAEELVSVAMHLSLNQPDRKLQYWIRIEREN